MTQLSIALEDRRSPVFLVTGGRTFGNRGYGVNEANELLTRYWKLHQKQPVLVHGGARGADAVAENWATNIGVGVKMFEADWANFGKRAGPRRNSAMVEWAAAKCDEGHPVTCFVFPGGQGTAHCLSRIVKEGLEHIVVKSISPWVIDIVPQTRKMTRTVRFEIRDGHNPSHRLYTSRPVAIRRFNELKEQDSVERELWRVEILERKINV